MAYMRAPFYVWSDGATLHLSDTEADDASISIPFEFFDVIVVMREAQLREAAASPEAYEAFRRKIATEHAGNAGSDALRRSFDLPDTITQVRREQLRYWHESSEGSRLTWLTQPGAES